MIKLIGFNSKEIVLNSELIEKIEEVPETLVTLVNGKKIIVKDTVDEVIEKVIDYKRRIHI
ncbi:flagellar FlbD family protein [Clostridium bornimense]|uniref:flagellar FlbD family protein n=1 Tax=Clostridium bornimense TaxID=1216932 RepID=UPI001C10250D|nr:flagellar FlbD family protein [Clostridium bornimense]MBU5314763.1 flagellar FlbD family protein [Clostridium bornimense]